TCRRTDGPGCRMDGKRRHRGRLRTLAFVFIVTFFRENHELGRWRVFAAAAAVLVAACAGTPATFNPAGGAAIAAAPAAKKKPHADNVVVVIMENRDYSL